MYAFLCSIKDQLIALPDWAAYPGLPTGPQLEAMRLLRASAPNSYRPAKRMCRPKCTATANAEAPPASATERQGERSQHQENVPISEARLRENAELVERLRGKLILAPLTKGGNVPFRRLCASFDAQATVSEMVFARQLLRKGRGNPVEKARLRRAENEQLFGFQIATNNIDEALGAAHLAVQHDIAWLDLNCGCPIHEATRRGLGSALLRNPRKLARLVAGIARQSPIPLSVKVRTGLGSGSINLPEVVEALQDTGIAFLTVHGRTQEQRYKRAADWDLIAETAAKTHLPIVGNGDILSHYEARRRLRDSGCFAVMTGRGALVKPWLFQEFQTGQELNLTARERVEIYRQLVVYMKEHFGDDARGRQKAWHFLPWHFSFFCRYRPYPEAQYGAQSQRAPLMSIRQDLFDPTLGETLDDLPLLERLLRCESEDAHQGIAAALYDSASDGDAAAVLERLADSRLLEWEEAAKRDARDADGRGGGLQVAEG